MTEYGSPFHAYDIRGRLGKEFTLRELGLCGFYIAQFFANKHTLCIGHDARSTSPQISAQLVQDIPLLAGVNVLNVGQCTTPQLYFSQWRLGLDCSIMITASHNPPEYNGLKVTGRKGVPIGYANGLKNVEAMLKKNIALCPVRKAKDVFDVNTKRAYLNFLQEFGRTSYGLKYAVDCMHGAVGNLVHDALADAALYLNDKPDGKFTKEGPNPTIASNRTQLEKAVRELQCDVGVIFDGDGDRVMFLDETGELVPPDLLIALIAEYLYGIKHRSKKRPVLVDIRTSKSVTEALEEMGVDVEVGRVGRVFMSNKLRNIKGTIGGELAGHYYYGDFNYFDSGLLTARIVLDAVCYLKESGFTLHEWVLKAKRYENSGELNFQVEEVRKAQIITTLRDHFTEQEAPTFVSDEDGYRVEFPDWWFSIRSSNTEPLLRLIVEARNEKMLQAKVAEARALILKK